MAMSDINELNGALDSCAKVAHKFIDQREVVDMGFLKDLTEIMDKLQDLIKELTQQGLERLP